MPIIRAQNPLSTTTSSGSRARHTQHIVLPKGNADDPHPCAEHDRLICDRRSHTQPCPKFGQRIVAQCATMKERVRMRVARIMPVTSRDEQRSSNENRSRIVLRCTKRSRPRECPSRQLCATVTSLPRPVAQPHRPIANRHTESRTKNILYLVSAFGERRATHTTSGMPSGEAASPRSSKRSIPNTMPRADILHVGLRVRSIRVAERQPGILHTSFSR